jgi:ABC-2 type transport system permease protein
LAAKGVRHQFRAAAVVWQREMIRFGRDRSRIVSAMVQPILFLFVMGTGLASGEVG